MKTKIKYESFKRTKEIISVKKAYDKYAEEIDEPIELQLYDSLDRFFNKEKYPPVGTINEVSRLYHFFEATYNLASEYKCYIYNDIDATFQYLRMGVIYYAMGYNAHKLQIKNSRYNDEIEIHEKFLYQAISVDEWELAKENASPCPIIQAMLNEEYDLAKELLENYTEETDEDQEPYFIHMPYVKQIYIAILNGDENEFNEQLAKRINKYRKRPSDYQPVIDTTSIALIKIASRLGLQYKFRVEEIPEFFLETKILIERTDCRIVDIEKSKQAFQEWGNITPSLEEIKMKCFVDKKS